ncbi:MAG: hypothetical protein AB7P40_31170 [Chloroflexota bacterium]
MNSPQAPGRLALYGYLAWLTATVGGASLGVVMGAIVGWLLSLPIMIISQSAGSSSGLVSGAQGVAGSLMLAIVAAGIGIGQSVVLEIWYGYRIRLPWIILTVLTWVVAAIAVGMVRPSSIWTFFLLKLVFGTAVGLGQLLVLRVYVPRAALWVAVSAVSLMLAESVSLLPVGPSILLVPASALIYGAVSGPGIVWLVLRETLARQTPELTAEQSTAMPSPATPPERRAV